MEVPVFAALRDKGILDAFGWKVVLVTAPAC